MCQKLTQICIASALVYHKSVIKQIKHYKYAVNLGTLSILAVADNKRFALVRAESADPEQDV